MITETEICIYREIYYETVKPMLKAGKSDKEITAGIEYACAEYGMEVEKYLALTHVDLMQRFSMTIKPSDKMIFRFSDGEEIDVTNLKNIPELRCPRRSEMR